MNGGLKLYNPALLELMVKLNGVVLRKAEILGDFIGVYSSVFERIFELGNETEFDGMEILGEVGV